MITFETIGKLESATLKEGDLVQVLGEFSEGDVALMTGKVYPALHASSNRLVTIANGLKVEVFPTPLGDKDVTKKYVNERDDKIKEQVNNLHTKRDAIEWRSGLRVTDGLQLYVHEGVEYLPDSGAVPFTTGSSFDVDNWVLSALMTQIKHWRAVGDIRGYGGVINTDVTNAVQDAIDSVGVCHFPFTDDNDFWLIDSVTTTQKTSFTCDRIIYIKALTPSVKNMPVFNILHDNSYFDEGIRIDIDNTSRSAVRCNGNNIEAHVWVENMSADVDASVTTSVLQLDSVENFVGSYESYNGRNTGHPNESTPRSCSVGDGTGTYHIISALMKNAGGHVTGGGKTARGTIDFMHSVNGRDQPIYAGTPLTISNLVTEDSEEGVIAYDIVIGDWTHYGSGSWLIGLNNTVRFTVNSLTIEPSRVNGQLFKEGIARTRSGNVSGGVFSINNLNFTMGGGQLFKFDIGLSDYLSIQNVKGTYFYSGISDPSQLLNFSKIKSFDFKNWEVKLIDTTNSLTSDFEMRFDSSVITKKSRYSDINIYVLNSDSTEYLPNFRCSGLFCDSVSISNVTLSTNTGQLIRSPASHGFTSDNCILSDNPPIDGYWNTNFDVSLTAAKKPPFRARCIQGGASSVWVAY